MPSWRNWAGNQQCEAAEIRSPSSEDEIVQAVRDAFATDRRVKMVGRGHSFTSIALSDGIVLRPEKYNRILSVDAVARTVTVQSGIRLRDLNEELAGHGLALENLGDIAYQTVAGAISTATHGTGRNFSGLAAQVKAIRLISADGSILECSAEQDQELFEAARVGLGAIGVLSTITIQCVPAFNLHAIGMPMRVDQVLESLDEHIESNDHFEFFWVPHTGWALTKRNRRTDEPAQPRGRWTELKDDFVLGNYAFDAICRIGRLRPSLIPRLIRALPATGRVEYIDRSDRVFASPRLVRFYEMEYAIPRDAAVEALNRVRGFIKESGLMISFPVEVRFTRGDDIYLSTAHGRDTCYIAVHVYQGMQYQQYFEAVENIMDDYGGRPHWGKLHFQKAETLASRYPRWDDFQRVRARVDPERVLSNPYLDRVLGRPGVSHDNGIRARTKNMTDREDKTRVGGESGDIDEIPPEDLGRSAQSRPDKGEATPEDKVEEASVDSFPASDPPAY
jgi:L-gulono-1,4-lactone dehydrogenase